MKGVRKWNIKTQQFETVDYAGYKANRAEMPADLIQQLPYIRRALEAFRIPILSYEGFEADDVIGTLSCKLAALGHHVFVVSSDKDMMQLVNADVSILNPTKDNLVLDPAGVEAALGVPPERVIDVMALRGDSVDNIPGAPGIGDKGSVELIQQFGSVEAALDAAVGHAGCSVKRKTYRESLQNNRDNILLSKELVTIHTSVPIDFSLDEMRTQPVDNAACRELFSELEFTTLLKELAPAADNTASTTTCIRPMPRSPRCSWKRASLRPRVARRAAWPSPSSKTRARSPKRLPPNPTRPPTDAEAEPAPAETMDLFAGPAPSLGPLTLSPTLHCGPRLPLGLAVEGNAAMEVALDAPGLRAALEDATLPKHVHDLKAVLRALAPHGITLRGVTTDVMLESYLVNPTHASHTLPDIAARSTNRALAHQPTKANPADPKRLPEAAAAIVRLARVFAEQMAESDAAAASSPGVLISADAPSTMPAAPLQHIYETMDLPLVPVLLRMEQAGVRIDSSVLSSMSTRLAVEMDTLAERIYTSPARPWPESAHRFNINSPKQLGDVLFNKMALPKPMKYGKGKVISTAQDVLEELAEHHPVPALVLEYRQLAKLRSTYLDSLPNLVDAEGRVHTTFNQVGTATGRLSSTNPEPAEHPRPHRAGPRDSRRLHPRARQPADVRRLLADRAAPDGALQPGPAAAQRLSHRPGHPHAHRGGGLRHGPPPPWTKKRATAPRPSTSASSTASRLRPRRAAGHRAARGPKLYIDRYFERYAGVRRFIDETLETVRRDQAVRTWFGRVRPIPDIQSRNPNMRGFAERTAINTPLQGTAADLIKLAMLRIDAAIAARKPALPHDPPGPRRTPLRRPPRRGRRTPHPRPARDGTRRRVLRPHRRRSRPRPQLARHQVTGPTGRSKRRRGRLENRLPLALRLTEVRSTFHNDSLKSPLPAPLGHEILYAPSVAPLVQ
jgi:DNA polymerase I